jgi:hypothetical protein
MERGIENVEDVARDFKAAFPRLVCNFYNWAEAAAVIKTLERSSRKGPKTWFQLLALRLLLTAHHGLSEFQEDRRLPVPRSFSQVFIEKLRNSKNLDEVRSSAIMARIEARRQAVAKWARSSSRAAIAMAHALAVRGLAKDLIRQVLSWWEAVEVCVLCERA